MKTSPEDMNAFWTDDRQQERPAPRGRPVYDVVALLARCGVGVVFLAHGWQKIQVGVNATGHNFDAMGVPAPTAAAVYSTFVELLGGTALILGVGLPVAGTLLFLDMAGAFVFVHAEHGVFLVDKGTPRNGFELVLVLGLVSLLFAAGGGGRLTLDHRLFGWGGPGRPPRRRRSRSGETPAPLAPGASAEPGGLDADASTSPGGRGADGSLDTSATRDRRGTRRKSATSPSPGAPDAAAAPDAVGAPDPSGAPQEPDGGTPAGRPKRGTMGTSHDVRVAGPKPEQEPPAEGTPPKGTSRARPRKGPSAKSS
ncbi:DoxX family protein [Actinoallomurus purpureus]|uniref:DoxX family protein n=1 Tax=Actinoallomurus purpureus TaxID=478114 RepID=UPI0020931FD5|nr:DoxX family protein [Actinoallomurus purpureus]MCO6008878.1 DoxX family protein [Actinoallomurus purpureus]